jgi:hypothetical protein
MPVILMPEVVGVSVRPIVPPTLTPVEQETASRLIAEGLISLPAVAKMLPNVHGKRVSTSAIFRWIVRGKIGVKLEAVRLAGTGWWTSQPAVARFAAALTNAA